MIKVGTGFFEHPKGTGKECCFAVALINYFRLNNIPVNETELFERHLSSPYVEANGGLDMLLNPLHVEYMTLGEYTARLYHPIVGLDITTIGEKMMSRRFSPKQNEIEKIFEKSSCSLEKTRELSQPMDRDGTIVNVYDGEDAKGIPYGGHAIVRLNPRLFGPQTHIDVDGNVYWLSGGENMFFAGCLDIMKSN